jgi:hypothetical protein
MTVISEIWDGCVSRVFDIRYESGSLPQNFRSEIRAFNIQRVAEIGASVVITVYPESGDFAPPAKPIQKDDEPHR